VLRSENRPSVATRPPKIPIKPTARLGVHGTIMETEDTVPHRNYRRSLLAIAELIKAIVEEMSEQEVQQAASQQQFTDEFSATDL
jgi:hypothetical protein